MDSTDSSSRSSTGLDYYWLILKRRWLPASAVFVIVSAVALLTTLLKKPTYVAEGMLRFERRSLTTSLTGLGKDFSILEPLVEKSNPLATETEVIRSNPVTQEALKRLNLKDDKGLPLKKRDFLTKLKVSEIQGTDILKLSYLDASPEQTAAVVNVLMEVYIENNIRAHRAQAAAAREFIDKQLPKAEVDVSRAEEAFRQFKEANDVIVLKDEAAAAVSTLTDLQRQMATTQAQIVNSDGEAEVLRSKLGIDPRQAVVIASLSQSPGVQEVLKERQRVESDLAIERSRSQEDNPKVINLREKSASLNQLLQERIAQVPGISASSSNANLQMGTLQQDLTKELVSLEGKRQGLARQFSSLSQIQAAYGQRARSLPRLEKEQRELERHLEASQATYSQLLQKVGEIRVAENQNVGNARIISPAQIPDKPFSSKNTSILAAVLLGLLAAGATVYILEARDKSIKTIEQARSLFGFTLLGVIPHHNQSKKALSDDNELGQLTHAVVVKDAPTSAVSGAYRILYANLKFLSSDKPNKVIVISSSVPQEGKSTISANLATIMAQLGRRVLLVDGDMHRPVQHRIWDLSNAVGLSNMLVEQAEPERAIKAVTVNLDVLTSGVVPPNSIALLDSQRMSTLVENFAASYDFVIIDTPPLTLATDALIVGNLADGIVLVVRPEGVDVGSATFAKGLLARSGQNVLGQVINGVIAKNDPHSDYYFASDHYAQRGLSSSEVPTVITGRTLE